MQKTQATKFTGGLTAAVLALTLSNVLLTASNLAVYSDLGEKDDSASALELASVKDTLIELESKIEAYKTEKSTATTTDINIDQILMDNPESIVKSLAKYRFEQEQAAKSQAQEKIVTLTDEIYLDKNDPHFGNPNGRHVVVEFIDYNCGYCKKLAPVLEEFVKIDPEAKVIVKEYPIFTNQPTSAYSALMGTALFYAEPELYGKYHELVINERQITKEFVNNTLAELGAPKEALQPFMDKALEQIEKVRSLGAQLEVSGTPTVFINGERSHGGFTAQQLVHMFNSQ